jgi:hypothetical protein
MKTRKANWIGHILRSSCLLRHVIEGKRQRREGRRRKKENRGYWKIKEEAVDRSVWRTLFGRGRGLDVSQTTKWLNN